MQRFRDYLAKRDRAPPLRGTTGKSSAASAASKGSVDPSSMQSLDAASLWLPADTNAEVRASLFKEFWDALVAFRHRDILVVAMCADHDE